MLLSTARTDLDDVTARRLRQAITVRFGTQGPVLSLALALRVARLQLAFQARISAPLRQQLAVDTIQLWAPLAHQAGLARLAPDLELHSFVLLFPKSFDTFIDWYAAVRPVARSVLQSLRRTLQSKLSRDGSLVRLASQVTLQVRLRL